MALNILQQEATTKDSLRSNRICEGWDETVLDGIWDRFFNKNNLQLPRACNEFERYDHSPSGLRWRCERVIFESISGLAYSCTQGRLFLLLMTDLLVVTGVRESDFSGEMTRYIDAPLRATALPGFASIVRLRGSFGDSSYERTHACEA